MEVLSPSEIRYFQDSISNKFTDGTSLTSTFALLLDGQLSVSSLPAMGCFWMNGSWYAVSGNRRLFLYKHLEDAGVLDTVTVSRARGYNSRKFTTKCNGLDVRCRGHGLEASIEQIVAEWRQGKDVVAKWGADVATGNFSTYRDGSSYYDDDSDSDDDRGWYGSDESNDSDYGYYQDEYDPYW